MAIALLLAAGCTVLGNLAAKTGADQVVAGNAVLGFLNGRILLGIGCFGAAYICYTLALQRVALDTAQSFIAVQYIGVILASWLILNEPISLVRWAGVALIMGGIFLVGYSR